MKEKSIDELKERIKALKEQEDSVREERQDFEAQLRILIGKKELGRISS